MKSPFDDLEIERALVCEFIAAFMRFEYAMKATEFCGKDRYGNAQPNWDKLIEKQADMLNNIKCRRTRAAIKYLNCQPPQVQIFADGQAVFCDVLLRGATEGARSIEAAKRVRNNLFHGGKHTQHSPPKRDEALICAAMRILDSCLKTHPHLQSDSIIRDSNSVMPAKAGISLPSGATSPDARRLRLYHGK